MYEIRIAESTDVDGVTTLLQANSPSRGGSLTGEFSREMVAKMISSSPVVVAKRAGEVVGVLISSTTDIADGSPPSVRAMLAAWPGGANAYVYGPACIAGSERGQGLLAKLYAVMKTEHAGGEAVLFIRRDNIASMRAHEKLGMHEVASFILDEIEYAVLNDI